MTFDEYYFLYYLPKHSRPMTKLCHMAGVITTIVWLLYALTQTSGLTLGAMLLASPFVVYLFAWPSHLLFEPQGGRIPAALTSNPLRAKAADLRMCWELLTGKLEWDG